MPYRRITEINMRTTEARLRVVEESDTPFADDEFPSLPGMKVYDTTGEDVTHVREAQLRPLAKCGARVTVKKKAVAR